MSDKKLRAWFDGVPVTKGGPGSGNWGHAGRPGKRGGSVPKASGMSLATGQTAQQRQALAKLSPEEREAGNQGAFERFVEEGTYLDTPGSEQRFKKWMGKKTAKLTEIDAFKSPTGQPGTVLSVRSANRTRFYQTTKIDLGKVEHRKQVGEDVKRMIAEHERETAKPWWWK
jgi:hypothetical protein